MKLLPALAVATFVVCAGLAVATLLRPAGGYDAALPLVRAILLGSGSGALVLVGLASAIVLASSGGERSVSAIGRAAASLPAIVASTLVIVAIEVWPSSTIRSTDGVREATFARWQSTIVPLTVSFNHLLQALAAAQRAPDNPRLDAAARRAPSRLRRLARAVGLELTRDRGTPELQSITSEFARAIRYAAVSATDLAPPSTSVRGSHKAALSHAKAQLLLAAQATQKFTFRANGLGGRLAAVAGPGGG